MGFADDYVQVNQRIEKFKEEYPDGSLQSEIIELTDKRVAVKGFAYRTPDDQRPGIGHSFMNIPGSTQFTRGSELENTETSAWGRALAALGYEVKKSVASAEEVANKTNPSIYVQKSSNTPPATPTDTTAMVKPTGLTPKQRALLMAKLHEAGITDDARSEYTYSIVGKRTTKEMNGTDLDALLNALDLRAQVAEIMDDKSVVIEADGMPA